MSRAAACGTGSVLPSESPDGSPVGSPGQTQSGHHADAQGATRRADTAMQHFSARMQVGLRFAILVTIAAAAAAAAQVSVTLSQDRPSRASITDHERLRGTSVWLNPQRCLRPTSGSPAAFRLADQGSVTRWRNTQPDLYPTPGSPAAFRLADQRNLQAIDPTCRLSAAEDHPR